VTIARYTPPEKSRVHEGGAVADQEPPVPGDLLGVIAVVGLRAQRALHLGGAEALHDAGDPGHVVLEQGFAVSTAQSGPSHDGSHAQHARGVGDGPDPAVVVVADLDVSPPARIVLLPDADVVVIQGDHLQLLHRLAQSQLGGDQPGTTGGVDDDLRADHVLAVRSGVVNGVRCVVVLQVDVGDVRLGHRAGPGVDRGVQQELVETCAVDLERGVEPTLALVGERDPVELARGVAEFGARLDGVAFPLHVIEEPEFVEQSAHVGQEGFPDVEARECVLLQHEGPQPELGALPGGDGTGGAAATDDDVVVDVLLGHVVSVHSRVVRRNSGRRRRRWRDRLLT
jgi:hypothetical protein